MPFVHRIVFRPHASQALTAAFALAFAAFAAPCHAYGDALPDAYSSAAVLDGTSVAPAAALDDHTLAGQRGTGPGLMTVAVSGQMLHGAPSVTLWDEIAPPTPVPLPGDAAQVAQSNSVSYFRK